MKSNSAMSVKLQDISNQLGLSISTVSKALNGYPDVSQKTRERVKAVAHALEYYPSSAARNLRRGRTDRVGLLVNNPISYVSEYIAESISGTTLTAEQKGNNLLIFTTAVCTPSALKRICRARNVDGLILVFEPSVEAIKVLKQEDMPFVVLGHRVEHPWVSYIAPDNESGAYDLTKHLIEQGHERIGFTTRPQLGMVNQDRFAGYRRALADANFPLLEELIVETHIEPLSGYIAMNAFLDMALPPTAVFAFYDLMAVDAIRAAQDRGLRVPEDIAIAGFDGLRASLITQPTLTTVQQPLSQMGKQAIHSLFSRINDNTQLPIRQIFPIDLIVRQSTTFL